MHPHDVYALAAALASGALAVLHGFVWRAQRTPWSLAFAVAYVATTLLFAFDASLRPREGTPHPGAALLAVVSTVATTLGMVSYVGLAGRSARAVQAAALGAGAVMLALVALRQVGRLPGFAVLGLYLLAQAAMALHAMRREPGRGHGFVVMALLSYPAVVAAAAAGFYDVSLLRYAVAVSATLMGMTVLTTGLLRAQQSARDELAGRHRAEAELRVLNEALEQRVLQRTADLRDMVTALEGFNRSISHDLRGPLGGIAGVSRLASESLDAGDVAGARPLLDAITRQAESSAELVDALLALARVNDADLSPRPVQLGTLVAESLVDLRMAQPHAPPHPVHVAPLPDVVADPALLRQLFVNLIGNALRFSSGVPSPQVEVGAYLEGPGHVLFVRDNGVGFDPAAAGRLFEPFQRLHAVTHGGHGVGLSIVRRIVERHGGRVWAHAAPGAGATFYAWLPDRGVAP